MTFGIRNKFFCTFLPLLLAGGSHYAAAGNLLANGDFEQVPGESPAGWTNMNQATPVKAIKDSRILHGQYSAYLKSNADITDAEPQKTAAMLGMATEAVKPGQTCRVTFYARGDQSGQPLTLIFYTHPSKNEKHWYRKKELILTEEWKKYTLEETIPNAAEWKERKLGMLFSIPRGGACIDDVVLEAKNAEITASGRLNLLENPGFDLGIAGWFAETWDSKWANNNRRMERDFSIRNEGTCSLKLYDGTDSLISRRYQFKPDTKYTLSFYARCDNDPGNGMKAFIITPTWKIASLEIPAAKLSKEWKRFFLTFEFPSQGNSYANSFYLRMDPHGTVWIDSLQLEEGTATTYNPGIQAGLEPLSKNGICQTGTEAEIKVYATRSSPSLSSPLMLSLQGSNAEGTVIWTRTEELKSGEMSLEKTVKIPTDKVGVVDLNLKLTEKATPEKPLASTQWRITVISGLRELPLNPLIGLDTDPIWHSPARAGEDHDLAAGMGAGFVRTFFPPSWGPGECSRFNPNDPLQVKSLRERLEQERKSGKKIMVDMGPELDSPLNFHRMTKTGKIPSAAELAPAIEAYAKHVAANIKSMNGLLTWVEVLNEPNIWFIAGNNAMPPEVYVEVLKKVHQEVRATDPKILLAANTNGIDLVYITKLMKLGAADYIDLITVHSYRNSAENPLLFNDYRRLREILDKFRPGLPVVNSEQYYGVRNLIYQHEFDRNYFSDSEEDMAGRMLQTGLHGIAADLVPFGQFTSSLDVAQPGISSAPYYYHYFGMIRNMSSLLNGVVRGEEIIGSKSLRIFLFERRDGSKVVSANTRIFGIKGTVKTSLPAQSVLDSSGNRISGEAIQIGFTPTYWVFGPETGIDAIKSAFSSATCRGFDFPIEITAAVRSDKKLQLNLQNVTAAPASGNVKITGNSSPWITPEPLNIKLAPGAKQEITLAATAEKTRWDTAYNIKYIAQADDQIITRTLRLPSFIIQHADKNDLGWKNAEWLKLGEKSLSRNFEPQNQHRGPADLAAKIAFRWDDLGLYMAVRVKDDVIHTLGQERNMYAGDSLQLYFDCRNSAVEGANGYDRDDVIYMIGINAAGKPQAYLEKGPGTRYVGEANAETGIDSAVQITYRTTATGYEYDLFFPNYTLPFLELKSGSLLGISLLINDNDGQGRKQGLTMGPAETEPFGKPFLWRCGQLGE